MADYRNRSFWSITREVAKLAFIVLLVFMVILRVTGEGRLYRGDDRMIAGVAGGVAEYFRVDPTMVRVLWAVSALYYGVGAGAYLLAWLIIPSRPL